MTFPNVDPEPHLILCSIDWASFVKWLVIGGQGLKAREVFTLLILVRCSTMPCSSSDSLRQLHLLHMNFWVSQWTELWNSSYLKDNSKYCKIFQLNYTSHVLWQKFLFRFCEFFLFHIYSFKNIIFPTLLSLTFLHYFLFIFYNDEFWIGFILTMLIFH